MGSHRYHCKELLDVSNSAAAQMKYLGNTLVKTAPLLMCGLSVLFAYKVGLFNIGAAGQYVVGAGAALYCALALGHALVCVPAGGGRWPVRCWRVSPVR